MAWWLAYEELYGDMDKEYPIMSDNDTIGIGTDVIGAADTVPFNFGGSGEDVVIALNGSVKKDTLEELEETKKQNAPISNTKTNI